MRRCASGVVCWPCWDPPFLPHSHVPPPPCLTARRDTYVKQEPGESPNDRNDRAIRRAAEWYAQRLPVKPILLLTDDAGNRTKANDAGVEAMSCAVS